MYYCHANAMIFPNNSEHSISSLLANCIQLKDSFSSWPYNLPIRIYAAIRQISLKKQWAKPDVWLILTGYFQSCLCMLCAVFLLGFSFAFVAEFKWLLHIFDPSEEVRSTKNVVQQLLGGANAMVVQVRAKKVKTNFADIPFMPSHLTSLNFENQLIIFIHCPYH